MPTKAAVDLSSLTADARFHHTATHVTVETLLTLVVPGFQREGRSEMSDVGGRKDDVDGRTDDVAGRMRDIDDRLGRIARQPFRAKFHLRGRDRATAELRGMPTIRLHGRDLIFKRLAPAAPYKDGKQTPYRGHPVFVAQHATATCCRNCLERWHEIPKGHELSKDEQTYVVDVICRWIERELRVRP
jgi:hypothetical protein